MIAIRRDAAVPLGEQIADGLAALIAAGGLSTGARLPSVRQMAARLGVSPFTVGNGYDRLVARNLIAARPGAGYFVAGPPAAGAPEPGIETLAGDPAQALGFALLSLDATQAAVRAGSGFLPEAWLADVVPSTLVARVARGRDALRSSAPAPGSPELRALLSERLRHNGIAAAPGQIVTSIGASQGLDFVMRAMLRPGDTVAVEDPGYMFFAAQVRARDLRAVAVPRLADGPDLDALAAAAERHRPRAFVTQSLLHNPTGGSISAARAHRLLMLAERHDFIVIEDDVCGDLAARGAVRLAALDGLRRVFYVSSFSKLLSPALRVGYVAAPAAAVEDLLRQKVLGVLGTPGLTESIVAGVLASGRYERHIQRLRAKLAVFRRGARELLATAGVRLEEGASEGPFLWGSLDRVTDPVAFVRDALERGILLAHGGMFSPTGRFGSHFRFNVAHSTDARLADFLRGGAPAATAKVLPLHAVSRSRG